MNILMLTNTFPPFVGGVARSVERFTDEFRRNGHRVVVAAPTSDGAPKKEADIVRYPAIHSFNGSGFSMPLVVPGRLKSLLKQFKPDVVHSHHPFLLGATGMRIAAGHNVPLVFTHHTMYEKYTHYVPGDSPRLKRFVTDVVTGYCNFCDTVIAPSETVAALLRARKVTARISVIPTGVNTDAFISGDGAAMRRRLGIPTDDAFVIGHVGRLAPEKNLDFLSDSIIRFLQRHHQAHFVLVGAGPLKRRIHAAFEAQGLGTRLHAVGPLERGELADAYKAMDVFAFASHTETQGMVLAEAMAAGVPVVAIEASGVSEVVCDGSNGRLLKSDNAVDFNAALDWTIGLTTGQKRDLDQRARDTAADFDIRHTAAKAVDLYAELIEGSQPERVQVNGNRWAAAQRRVRGEWRIMRNLAFAAGDSMHPNMVWEIDPTARSKARPVDNAPAPEAQPTPPSSARKRSMMEVCRARVLGFFWAWLLRLQFATWRKRCDGMQRLDQILGEGRRVMFSFWHGKYVPLFALLRGHQACVFTSESARGDVIVDICRRFGYHCVQIPDSGRGYSLNLMRQALANHQNGGIAVDGPLGPYHRVKKGAVKLASEMGCVIVPASVYARHKRVLKHRWDRMELPRLFTRVGFAIGEPIIVPSQLGAEDLRRYTETVHESLEALERQAAELVDVTEADRPPLTNDCV